jgi:hypothetical protein
LKGDIEVLSVVTWVELVVEGFLKPCAPLFIVDEKTKYDGILAASGPLRNARRRAVPWRRQIPWVGIYVDIEASLITGYEWCYSKMYTIVKVNVLYRKLRICLLQKVFLRQDLKNGRLDMYTIAITTP